MEIPIDLNMHIIYAYVSVARYVCVCLHNYRGDLSAIVFVYIDVTARQ